MLWLEVMVTGPDSRKHVENYNPFFISVSIRCPLYPLRKKLEVRLNLTDINNKEQALIAAK